MLGRLVLMLGLLSSFSFMESPVLPAMTFHCYVAICCLLRWSPVLTSARIGRIGLVSWAGPCVSSSIPPLLELGLPLPDEAGVCRRHIQ